MALFETPQTDIELGKKVPAQAETLLKNDGGGLANGGARKRILDGACICLNIASTVVLVLLNKWYDIHILEGYNMRRLILCIPHH
jgi:hypothetical protein